jgi:hypothetical protein
MANPLGTFRDGLCGLPVFSEYASGGVWLMVPPLDQAGYGLTFYGECGLVFCGDEI